MATVTQRQQAKALCARRSVERITGKRPDGTWETAGWLIGKAMAHVERVGSYRMPRPHVSRWPRLGPHHAIAPAIV
jgi:hypothetical protein